MPIVTLTRLPLLMLLVLSIASCQRATYSFQPVASQQPASLPAARPDSNRYENTAPLALATEPPAARQQPVLRRKRQRQAIPARRAAPALPLLLRVALANRPAHRAVVAAAPAKPSAAEIPPLRRRSRVLAAVLAGISLVYPYGIQYFYLGYTGRGLAVLGILLLTLYLLAVNGLLLSASAPLGPFGVAAIAVFTGLFIWQLYDFVRILNGTLQPKDGEYRQPPSA